MSTLDDKLKTNLPQVKGQKLVALYNMHPNGKDIDTDSVRHNYFDDNTFKEYEREDEATGKTNSLHALGLKYQVIEGKESVKEPKTSEIDVEGIKFILTEDDGGFVAEEKEPKGPVAIKADGKKKADVISKLKEIIKADNAK